MKPEPRSRGAPRKIPRKKNSMNNFVHDGKIVSVTAPYIIASGGGAKVGHIFGIAQEAYASGDSAQLLTEGVVDLVKDASTFSVGDKVYWDDTNKVGTSTSTSNISIGAAVQAQVTGDTTVRVRLSQTGALA
jgi:predicted RecA/RadA family phage recombinase